MFQFLERINFQHKTERLKPSPPTFSCSGGERDVWWEDFSVNETDETRQRRRRVNKLILAAWSPGLGSALQGEYRSVWHSSRLGDAGRSPTFDLILTQAWTSPWGGQIQNMKGLKVRSSVISVSWVSLWVWATTNDYFYLRLITFVKCQKIVTNVHQRYSSYYHTNKKLEPGPVCTWFMAYQLIRY